MIENVGDRSFKSADRANVPVDLRLRQVWKPDLEKFKWYLCATNYMPREGRLIPNTYEAYGETREELAALVREHVLPLYEAALEVLQGVIDGTSDGLHYWEKK